MILRDVLSVNPRRNLVPDDFGDGEPTVREKSGWRVKIREEEVEWSGIQPPCWIRSSPRRDFQHEAVTPHNNHQRRVDTQFRQSEAARRDPSPKLTGYP